MRWIDQPHRSDRVSLYSRSSRCCDHLVGTMEVGQFDGVLPVSGTHQNLEHPFEWLAVFDWDVAAWSRENLVQTRLHELVHPPRGVGASVVVDGLSAEAIIFGVQSQQHDGAATAYFRHITGQQLLVQAHIAPQCHNGAPKSLEHMIRVPSAVLKIPSTLAVKGTGHLLKVANAQIWFLIDRKL